MQRMFHPDHGYTHAYDNAEVKRLKEAGWEKQNEAEFQALIDAKLGDEVSVRRGRPKKIA